jgi:outer membrane lipoprotein-sorting protein
MNNSMRYFSVFVVMATFVAACPALLAEDLLSATFTRMDNAAASFKGMTAQVKQISHNDFLGVDDVQSGTMAVKRSRPHDLRALVNLTTPDQKQVELNGHNVQIYYPKSNTVEYANLDKKTTAVMDQLLLLSFGSTAADIQGAYTVQLGGPETVDGQKTVRLILTPKKPDSLGDIVNIELWVSDSTGMAIRQKLDQRGKDYLLAVYSNMKLVPNLPDSDVKMKVPKDAHREQILH